MSLDRMAIFGWKPKSPHPCSISQIFAPLAPKMKYHVGLTEPIGRFWLKHIKCGATYGLSNKPVPMGVSPAYPNFRPLPKTVWRQPVITHILRSVTDIFKIAMMFSVSPSSDNAFPRCPAYNDTGNNTRAVLIQNYCCFWCRCRSANIGYASFEMVNPENVVVSGGR